MNIEKLLEWVWFSWADWVRVYPRILFADMMQRPQYLWIITTRDPRHLHMSIWKWSVEYRTETKVKYDRLMRKGRFFEAAKFLYNM